MDVIQWMKVNVVCECEGLCAVSVFCSVQLFCSVLFCRASPCCSLCFAVLSAVLCRASPCYLSVCLSLCLSAVLCCMCFAVTFMNTTSTSHWRRALDGSRRLVEERRVSRGQGPPACVHTESWGGALPSLRGVRGRGPGILGGLLEALF